MEQMITKENEWEGFEILDQLMNDFFVKEREALVCMNLSKYVFTIIKRNNKGGHGNAIFVYEKSEFAKISDQDWYMACDFETMFNWLSTDKDSKKKMYFNNRLNVLYDNVPEFQEFIKDRNLEQYFVHHPDSEWCNKLFQKCSVC